MNREIDAFAAQNQFFEVLAAVQKGHSFTITRHGVGVASLAPVGTSRRRRARRGCARGEAFWMAPDFDAPLPEFAALS